MYTPLDLQSKKEGGGRAFGGKRGELPKERRRRRIKAGTKDRRSCRASKKDAESCRKREGCQRQERRRRASEEISGTGAKTRQNRDQRDQQREGPRGSQKEQHRSAGTKRDQRRGIKSRKPTIGAVWTKNRRRWRHYQKPIKGAIV